MALLGSSPHDCFQKFQAHIGSVISRTLPTQAIVHAFEATLEADTYANRLACMEESFDLEAATERTERRLEAIRDALLSTEGLPVRLEEMRRLCEALLSDEPRYMERPDVKAAIERSLAEWRRGDVEEWPAKGDNPV